LDATLLGLDLAWSERNPSGAVRLARRADGVLEVVERRTLGRDDEVLAWLEQRAPRGPALVGIDAPLIAPNPAGTARRCDRKVSARLGRFHAGVYPANRARCERPLRLAARLLERGWTLDPWKARKGSWRGALEVFPHAAAVGLLGLERIVKYKKGPVAARRAGLERLQDLLHERLPRGPQPLMPFEREQIGGLRGRGLKDLEDRLDALLCAAMTARWLEAPWTCEVIGDPSAGYVLVPRLAGGAGGPRAMR
jgi:predicted RNase H-like nuclease